MHEQELNTAGVDVHDVRKSSGRQVNTSHLFFPFPFVFFVLMELIPILPGCFVASFFFYELDEKNEEKG